MQVSVESLGNLERRMTFRLPAERIDTQVGGRLREIARTARIKGFRPGKVPAKVIEQHRGPKGVAFKFKRRKGFHKTKGFRRHLTKLEITSIAG